MRAQILGRAPLMEHFRMVSCRVGATGGIALAQGLSIGNLLLSARNYVITPCVCCFLPLAGFAL